MRRSSPVGIAVLLVIVCTTAVAAQWGEKDPTLPRAADGTPVLTGPTPRRADGRPDLQGLWGSDPPKFRDLSLALKPGDAIVMTPQGAAIFDQRKTGALSAHEPDANCLPQGVPKASMIPSPFKIVQQPDLILVVYEAFSWYRQLHLDGRQLPKDPNPQWFGYSVARWDGDTLVVDSSGFNGKAWLDQQGRPSTESLRVTERFRRLNLGRMELEATIDDPGAYAKPFTVVQPLRRLDSDLMEYICNENNRAQQHMIK